MTPPPCPNPQDSQHSWALDGRQIEKRHGTSGEARGGMQMATEPPLGATDVRAAPNRPRAVLAWWPGVCNRVTARGRDVLRSLELFPRGRGFTGGTPPPSQPGTGQRSVAATGLVTGGVGVTDKRGEARVIRVTKAQSWRCQHELMFSFRRAATNRNSCRGDIAQGCQLRVF